MMAFAQLEPFGGTADDFRAGQVAAVIANVNRDPERTPDPYSARDFMASMQREEQVMQEASPLRGSDLDAEQLSLLLDAELFGKAH